MAKMKNNAPQHAKRDALSVRPKYLRTYAKGITEGDQPPIERDGGDFGAGLIRGMSLCTRGEALGHDVWLDTDFIGSVVNGGKSAEKGVKSRFTHPGLSGDGLGTFLGRVQNHRMVGDKAVGDLHFSKAAHKTPDGDLAEYTMDRAEEDPASFAVSIVYEPDFDAEAQFILANGGQVTASGYVDDSEFVSPDPDNTKNLPHARLTRLRAADMVDEPAANPDGLFHREQQFAQEADAIASYALGLSDSAPTCVNFSVHPDRVKNFVSRFLEAHSLQLASKETPMKDVKNNTTVEGESASETGAGEAEPTDAPNKTNTGEQSDGNEGRPQKANADEAEQKTGDEGKGELSEGKQFLDAFGDQGGVWYAQGKTFDEAKALHAQNLQSQNESLQQQVTELQTKLQAAQAAAGAPANDAAGFDGADEGDDKPKSLKDVIKLRSKGKSNG